MTAPRPGPGGTAHDSADGWGRGVEHAIRAERRSRGYDDWAVIGHRIPTGAADVHPTDSGNDVRFALQHRDCRGRQAALRSRESTPGNRPGEGVREGRKGDRPD